MIRAYQITTVGASHTRKEYGNGEPVGQRSRDQKEADRKAKREIAYKRYGYGDVIKLEEATARSQGVAHLKLRQTTGMAKAKKEDDEPFYVPLDWEQSGAQAKRALAAKISGKDFKRINATDADQIIRGYLATLPTVGDVISAGDEGAGDGAGEA
jgi:hypothetical protein